MKKVFAIFFALIFLFATQRTYAAYVLPYPSTMPGGLSYKIHLIWEYALKYWYFGDYGQYEYALKESDKYLVEGKTLCEYQQYLLCYTALQKSNTYFVQTLPHLLQAKSHGKDIAQKREELSSAASKHSEVLQKMMTDTPDAIIWSPEKSAASKLNLHQLINKSLVIRKKYL